jgi:nucleotide-binding universal stress UspA family protein
MSGGPLIVVGVSARTGSPAALEWAVNVASQLDGRVRAVMAWRPPRAPAAPGGRPPVVSSTGPAEPPAEVLEQFVAAALETAGEKVPVEEVVQLGGPVRVLLSESRTADLLVIDSPRREKLASAGKLVAPRLIHRSACPVVVMPATAGARRPRGRLISALVDPVGLRAAPSPHPET